MNYNKVIIAGNLTRNPELRYTPQGTAYASFDIALNRRWTDSDGNKQEKVVFVPVEAWRKQAESISSYVQKGSPLLVEGRIEMDSWEKGGQKRTKLKVAVERFEFIGEMKEKNEPSEEEKFQEQVENQPEDDVPF